MFIYRIVDTAEPTYTLAYATTSEEAIALAKEAAQHYAGLEFSGAIEVHRIRTNELFYGGIVHGDVLFETVPFTAIIDTDEDELDAT